MQASRWYVVVRVLGALVVAGAAGWCSEPGATNAQPRQQQITAPKAKFHSRAPGYTNWWLAWSKDLHLGGYERAGKKDPKWDEPARKALEYFAYLRVIRQPPPGAKPDALIQYLKQATDAGCTDPFVQYLYARQRGYPPEGPTPEVARQYSQWAEGMQPSGWARQLKFYVNLRTAQAWQAAFTNQVPEVNRFRRAAMEHLLDALRTEEMPAGAACEAWREFFWAVERNPGLRSAFCLAAEPLLLARWADEAFPYALKGTFYVKYAWDARGGGWASSVTEEGWKLFAERLGIAEQALDKAWKLDPSFPATPLQFMAVELGQGKGRKRMETWFQRAIAFPENRYDAVQQKLWYLQPRWHGSEEECLAAAREILKSDLFTNQVPLHLYHTHESLATYFKDTRPNYWTEPQVWPDIKAAFDRYFQLNGDDTDWRHNYVLCAFRCQQWKVLKEEIPKLKWVNYPYFGGREAFERMKAQADEMTAKKE